MACYNVSVIKVTPLKIERRTEMTDKAQAKLNELQVETKVIEKVDDIIENLERDKKYAASTYECVTLTDDDGEPILDENGKEKTDWQRRDYTEEELEDHPEVAREIEAYDIIIKALEKLI